MVFGCHRRPKEINTKSQAVVDLNSKRRRFWGWPKAKCPRTTTVPKWKAVLRYGRAPYRQIYISWLQALQVINIRLKTLSGKAVAQI